MSEREPIGEKEQKQKKWDIEPDLCPVFLLTALALKKMEGFNVEEITFTSGDQIFMPGCIGVVIKGDDAQLVRDIVSHVTNLQDVYKFNKEQEAKGLSEFISSSINLIVQERFPR